MNNDLLKKLSPPSFWEEIKDVVGPLTVLRAIKLLATIVIGSFLLWLFIALGLAL